MSVEVTNLDQLTQAEIQASEAFLRDFIANAAASLDTTPGTVFDQLITKFHALLHASNKATHMRYKESNSLLRVTEDPELADDDTVDKILSNYLIERSVGGLAAGQLLLLLDSKVFTPVVAGTEFSAAGITYLPTRSFSGVTSSDLILNSSHRLVFDIDAVNSEYGLLIDVVANTVGSAGNVRKNTAFTTTTTLSNLTQAVSAGDFEGGADSETNTDLINRLHQGPSTKNMGARGTIKAMLLAAFPTVSDVSVIGAGDPEMLRDKHSVLGISTHGKADLYVRSRTLPVTTTVTVSAALSSAANGSWVITFDRDTYAGMYRVSNLRTTGSTVTDEFTITAVQRNSDTTAVDGLDMMPQMYDNEHVFTRYQTTVVQFTDTNVTGLVAADTRDYDIDVTYMPILAEVNDFVLDRDNRHPAGDYLVKAPVPCLVAITINLIKGPGAPEPDTEAIKASVADAVNNTDFVSGKLSADVVIQAIRTHLSARTRIKLPIDMRGEILLPVSDLTPGDVDNDGSLWVFDTDELAIPYNPEDMATSRTVSYFLNSEDVQVNVLASDHLVV